MQQLGDRQVGELVIDRAARKMIRSLWRGE
jgi:hypothetical protein